LPRAFSKSGAAIGAILALPLPAWIAPRAGCRTALLIVGSLGYLWFAAWLSLYRKLVTADKRREERPRPSSHAIEVEAPLAIYPRPRSSVSLVFSHLLVSTGSSCIPGFSSETDWRDGVNSVFYSLHRNLAGGAVFNLLPRLKSASSLARRIEVVPFSFRLTTKKNAV
jgi:hypothetical protein